MPRASTSEPNKNSRSSTPRVPTSYVAEPHAAGFDFKPGDNSRYEFARACIELGHRLAREGKDIVEVYVIEDVSLDRCQREIAVRVKVRYHLKT
jgi:hypothetical protein